MHVQRGVVGGEAPAFARGPPRHLDGSEWFLNDAPRSSLWPRSREAHRQMEAPAILLLTQLSSHAETIVSKLLASFMVGARVSGRWRADHSNRLGGRDCTTCVRKVASSLGRHWSSEGCTVGSDTPCWRRSSLTVRHPGSRPRVRHVDATGAWWFDRAAQRRGGERGTHSVRSRARLGQKGGRHREQRARARAHPRAPG